MNQDEIDLINQKIADRSNVFYWQTDRDITPEQTGYIWADRHRYFTDDELKERIGLILKEAVDAIEPFDPKAQTNLGNINSVRIAHLKSGKDVIIRSHPRGIKNGYFHAESTASSIAIAAGVPGYKTLAIHGLENPNDFSFQIIEKLPGITMVGWLAEHPEDESELLKSVGRTMSKIHQVKVQGFGPFDNEKARNNKLIGLHARYADAIRAGLSFNLDVLSKEQIFTRNQALKIDSLFNSNNELLACDKAVLIHNDFADWNMLTDGKEITGALDWDECVGGDYISDIACWSTFFNPERLAGMLEGYFENTDRPKDFDEKLQLLIFRYVISKMTLRIRRYTWDPSESIKTKIEIGKLYIENAMKFFSI